MELLMKRTRQVKAMEAKYSGTFSVSLKLTSFSRDSKFCWLEQVPGVPLRGNLVYKLQLLAVCFVLIQ